MTNPESSLADRVVELETLVTHFQNDLEKMSDVMWQQHKEIEFLKSELKRMENLVAVAGQESEQRELPDERPPHY